MTLSRFLVAATVASLATAAAVAQGGGGAGMFRMADTNGDGMISRAEATAAANKRFDMLDLNKDGVLTADEMSGPGGRMTMRADTNGDGKVTREEFLAQAATRFERVDANGDGMISQEELRGSMDRARSMMQGRGRYRTDPADAVGPAPTASPNPGQ
jgi:Ca2+-binding EF-hand superfamily protein